MAGGVQGMAFAPAAAANKEKPGGFCWGDVEAVAPDFFDQFVELGAEEDADAGGLGQFSGGAHFSPHSHWGVGVGVGEVVMPAAGSGCQYQGFLMPGQVQSINHNSAQGANAATRDTRHRQNHLHPNLNRATTSMAGYAIDADKDGLPHGGSISDSELLKLEGLTMRSPRMRMPQLSASEPASPPSKNHNHHNTTPRKPAGRLETFCSKIRGKAAAVQGKGTKQARQQHVKSEPLAEPVMSTAQLQPEPAKSSAARPRPQQLSLSKTPLPSPPLTSSSLSLHQTVAVTTAGGGSDASFVNGFLDDPFLAADGMLPGTVQFVPPLQLNGSTMPQTPLQTPLMDGGWQLPMTTAPMASVAAKAMWMQPYFDDAPSWWDGAAGDAMETDLVPQLGYHHPTGTAGRVNLPMQLQHQQSFEYPAPPGTDDYPSTLLMHMPQPRGIPPSVLQDPPTTTTATATTTTPRTSRARPRPRAPSSGARHHQYAPGLSPRKGRTTTTTTTTGGVASSASRRCSVSPGPRTSTTTGETNNNTRLHRRSASLQTLQPQAAAGAVADATIRKRKSWATARRASSTSSSSTSLRAAYQQHTEGGRGSTPPAAAAAHGFPPGGAVQPGSFSCNPPASSSTHPYYPNPTPQNPPSSTRNSLCSSSNSLALARDDEEAATDGFVNYTPQDHTLLMTGVAPSGSSKTKARREREAAERQREFRERLERMVQAVGGDVGVLDV